MKKRIKKPISKEDEICLIGLYFIDYLLYANCSKERYKFISYLPKDMICDLHVVAVYRRYYLDKLTGKHVFLLDDWLKIKMHEHFSKKEKKFIRSKVCKEKATYSQVASIYNNRISPSTVYRLIKNQTNSYRVNFNSNPKNFKYIYIDIDDTFRNLRTKNVKVTHKFKVIHIYQYYDVEKKKFINETKLVLVNHTHLNSRDCMTWTIAKLRATLVKNYGNLRCFTLIVSGDGAKYIKTIAKAFNALNGLDRWHLFHKIRTTFKTQALRKIAFIYADLINNCSTKNNFAEQIIQLIKDKKIDEVFELLLKIKKLCDWNCQELNSLIAYFRSNRKSIEIWSNPIYYGTFTETYVQQLVKSYFGNVGRCFSIDIFMKMLNANCFAILYK